MNKLLHTLVVLGFLCPSICGQNTLAFTSIPSKHFSVSVDKQAKLLKHFDLLGGLILLNGSEDNDKKEYILDTGAPTLILNKAIKSKFRNIGKGISGSISVEEMEVNNFCFANENRNNIQALSMDLSHIEKVKKHKIGGLIGFDLIATKELFVDYPNQKIGFLTKVEKLELDEYQLVHSLPFKMIDHFPVVLAKINGVKVNLALDTGAEVNVMDKKILKKLKKTGIEIIEKKKLQGTDKKTASGVKLSVDELSIGTLVENFNEFTAIKMSKLTHEGVENIDGLLGYNFLKDKIISINFKTQRLYIYKHLNADKDGEDVVFRN